MLWRRVQFVRLALLAGLFSWAACMHQHDVQVQLSSSAEQLSHEQREFLVQQRAAMPIDERPQLTQQQVSAAVARLSQADVDAAIAQLSRRERAELEAGVPPPPRVVRYPPSASSTPGIAAAATTAAIPSPLFPFSAAAAAAAPPLSRRWAAWNRTATAAPLLPQGLAWLMYETGQRQRYAGTPFDADLAATLAAYVSVAYCNTSSILGWNCSRCPKAGPMTVYNVVFDKVWDLMAYAGYSRKLGAKMIIFRGTDSHSLYNWVENMHYWRTDYSVPFPNATGALVHTGFVASYNSSTLRSNLTEAMRSMQRWHPWAPVYVIGHSLGGALATLCALDMKYFFKLRDVRVYTFGSPRVGNKEFVDYFDWQVQESFRITHNRDLVPSVPLQIMGFRHIPTEVWQVDFAGHETLTVCDEGGEDPSCHDSMCYLGLCTSIADHLVYLGAHMYHPH